MHSLFAPVDTFDTSTYLHSVVYPNNSFALEWLMPVTGLESNGQAITPPGFDNNYGLYLTVDASGILGQTTPTPIAEQFTSINVTLWADPKNDAGTPSSTVENGASFSGPTSNDIVLATGTIVHGFPLSDSSIIRGKQKRSPEMPGCGTAIRFNKLGNHQVKSPCFRLKRS